MHILNDAVSMSYERQPFHKVDGELLDQRQWREKVRDCTELLEEFKRQAYKQHLI